MSVDLHTHTRYSDGILTPAELLERAAAAGVEVLSITDHDTVDAYEDPEINKSDRIRLIPGIEFSAQWRDRGVHVLGLNIDLNSSVIRSGIASQGNARIERGACIAERLQKIGIKDTLQGARDIAGHNLIGRAHFARVLVEMGVVNDVKQAFKKYLGTGKAGDVKTQWATLSQIVDWIQNANGIAVLAHPAKYKLTKTKLNSLLADYCVAGGQGMEVISGKQSPDITQHLANLCEKYQMLASVGSDFHQPGQVWAELGNVAALPPSCNPVWEYW